MKARTLHRLADKLWVTREAKCLSIIERALSMLREADDRAETEVELNRLLYFCLLAASRELHPDDVIAPVTECNNQPDSDDEARSSREQKRPDFQWIYLDRYESDPQRSSKQFVVECKRLGEAPRRDWVLNVNYSENGIRRFCDPEWALCKASAKRSDFGVLAKHGRNEGATRSQRRLPSSFDPESCAHRLVGFQRDKQIRAGASPPFSHFTL